MTPVPRAGTVRTITVLALIAAGATACHHKTTSQPTFTFSPITTSAAPAPVPLSDLQATPAPACGTGYVEVPMQPETDWERWYAPSLRVCQRPVTSTDGTVAELVDVKNGGPAIWVVDQFTGWQDAATRAGPVDVVAFRQATRSTYTGVAIEPGEDAQAQLPVNSPLEIHLDPGLQVEWSIITTAVHNAQQRIGRVISDALGPDGRALVACAQSAAAVTQTLQSDAPRSPADELQSVMTLAGQAQPCRNAVEAAEATEAQAGRLSELTIEDIKIPAEEDFAKLGGEGILGALFDITKFGVEVH